jgi:uncharacterized protein
VRYSAVGDVIKVWVWALGSLVVGLWLTPLSYNGGKALSELSASKDFNGLVNKLAAWSCGAGLEDFFRICWPLAALVFLFPLIEWLRLEGGGGGSGPWGIRLPHVTSGGGQPVMPGRWGSLQAMAGFLLAFGICILICLLPGNAGLLREAMAGVAWRENLMADVISALAIAAVIEVFFRGVVLGIFLRAMRVVPAVALAALMFGGIRFILGGFGNAEALDGETLSVGDLIGAIFGGGNVARRLAIDFLPWFTLGCVLGWARWRTASVWFPVGLLMGWLLGERLWVAGSVSSASVQAGFIPLLGVLAIGVLVHLFTLGFRNRRNACV